MHGNVVDAVADLGCGVGDLSGLKSAIDGPPVLASVIRSESTRRGDGDENPAWVIRIQQDGVQAHSTRARLPVGA